MKKVLLGIVIGVFALNAYQRVHDPDPLPQRAEGPMDSGPQLVERPDERAASTSNADTNFRCDGRTHCSQMTSCKEAKFFLQNCPGVKMDGDGDGDPCEEQWCRYQ